MVGLMSWWFFHNIMNWAFTPLRMERLFFGMTLPTVGKKVDLIEVFHTSFLFILNRKKNVVRIEKKRMFENDDELYMKVIRFTMKEY